MFPIIIEIGESISRTAVAVIDDVATTKVGETMYVGYAI